MGIFLVTLLFIFVFGAIVGSFLNVVVLRYNTGLPIVNGRSQCFSCAKPLTWKELIPIFSFLWQRGKCSSCSSSISWQYPAVEFVTATMFVLIFLKEVASHSVNTIGSFSLISEPLAFVSKPMFLLSNPWLFVTIALYFIIFSILIAITVYDFRHKIIPDGLVFTFIALSFARLFIDFSVPELLKFPYILDLFAGLILFAPFFLLWVVSKGEWIGLGDGKLAVGIGWMLGFVGGVSAIMLAFWIGAIFSIILMAIMKFLKNRDISKRLPFLPPSLTIKSEIPFAPFLVIGTVIVYFFTLDVIGIGLILEIL